MTNPDHMEAFTMPDDDESNPSGSVTKQNTKEVDRTMANVESQPGPTQTATDTMVAEKIPSGGAECALDMTDERDRALVRRCAKDRPKRFRAITEAVKDAMVSGLVKAQARAEEFLALPPDVSIPAINAISSISKTFVSIEALEQKDEHRAEDLDRMDSGKPTAAIKMYGVGTPTEEV
jgi:hypothetical protein